MKTMRFLAVLAGMWCTIAAFPGSAWALDLFIAPKGSDAHSGADAGQALKSLAGALRRARATAPSGEDVVVRFGAGDYGDMVLVVDWLPEGGGRLVLDGGTPAVRARFDGGGGARTWLVVRPMGGVPARIEVRNFEVRNYRGAIAFGAGATEEDADGEGDTVRARNSRIEGNLFENIGQFKPEVLPAFAAIGMTASRDNVIAGNTFRNIRNLKRCDGLHAIYLARGASGNTITGNLFDGGCGDTIKVRDGSNDNVIRGNTFRNQSGKSLFVDSFCDKVRIPECKSTRQECPSWRNTFADNEIDDESRRSVKAITRTVGRATIDYCPLPGVQDERIATGAR